MSEWDSFKYEQFKQVLISFQDSEIVAGVDDNHQEQAISNSIIIDIRKVSDKL